MLSKISSKLISISLLIHLASAPQMLAAQQIELMDAVPAHILGDESVLNRDVRVRVAPGKELETDLYYRRISDEVGFPFDQANLNQLLEFFGYTTLSVGAKGAAYAGLTAEDLEAIPSFSLMPRDEAEFISLAQQVIDPEGFSNLLSLSDFQNDKVLISRFFAPKISTYFKPSPDEFSPILPGEIVAGWRKLVKLDARQGSGAAQAGLSHFYLLFNYKKADPYADPFFENISGNNQVIIVPDSNVYEDKVFFLVYQSQVNGYDVGKFLAADFDLPGHSFVSTSTPGAPDGAYYVPRACAECHGHSINLRGEPVDPLTGNAADFRTGKYVFAKPNYLDTDQWYDWMAYDYPEHQASQNDVLFDGGKDKSSPEYRRAFGVIASLNQLIAEETLAAEKDPTAPSFQYAAAQKWLDLHFNDVTHQGVENRSIGASSWDTSNVEERRLLNLLNNHCFRCHSSLRYNIFDRDAVAARAGFISFLLEKEVLKDGERLPGFAMPQGRVLTDSDRQEIIDLIESVFP